MGRFSFASYFTSCFRPPSVNLHFNLPLRTLDEIISCSGTARISSSNSEVYNTYIYINIIIFS